MKLHSPISPKICRIFKVLCWTLWDNKTHIIMRKHRKYLMFMFTVHFELEYDILTTKSNWNIQFGDLFRIYMDYAVHGNLRNHSKLISNFTICTKWVTVSRVYSKGAEVSSCPNKCICPWFLKIFGG